jgi:hypothetical protein
MSPEPFNASFRQRYLPAFFRGRPGMAHGWPHAASLMGGKSSEPVLPATLPAAKGGFFCTAR